MQSPLSLDQACEALLQGRSIIFPTETFYAIGCNALDPDAVGQVFSIKKRSLSLPLPVVASSREQVSRLCQLIPQTASRLMDLFWPGPLSIILPARPEVPDLLTGKAGRVAIRCSPHPAVITLCQASGLLLVASSANVSGQPPVDSPDRLDPSITGQAAGVFVAGPSPAGNLPSTVVDIRESRNGEAVTILRQGAISEAALRDAGFEVILAEEAGEPFPPPTA